MTRHDTRPGAGAAAHTPGPWTHPGTGIDTLSIIAGEGADRTMIAQVMNPVPGGYDLAEANARLIAAAPDMLKALKLALDYYRSYGTTKFSPYEVEQALEKAITKAES